MLVEMLDRSLYPAHGDNWDDQMLRERIVASLRPDMQVLDVGAGRGLVRQMDFRGRVARVCGVDPDPRVELNPYLDEGYIGRGEELPFPGETFDLAFSDNVFEHLPDPGAVLGEVRRVLRPGAVYLVKTPNKWHPIPTVARLTSLGFHRFVNRLRGRPQGDTFPTLYRANTKRELQHLCLQAGLMLESVELVEGRPEYLRLTAITYLLGWLYERVVNSCDLLAPFRLVLIATMRRPPAS